LEIGKTIQIFLPDGNPRSIKIAEITSRTVEVLFIPRAKLAEAAKRDSLNNVALYFLVGKTEDDVQPNLYIGEAEDCFSRLQQHNLEKDFWSHALVVRSKTQYFTKTHIKFLEAFCYREASRAGRFELINNNIPNEPHLAEPTRADLMDNFETIKLLVSTLGYPIFDKIKRPPTKNLLTCKNKHVYAEGEYTPEGLVVFAGAKVRAAETKTLSKRLKILRRKLVEKNVLVPAPDNPAQYVLETSQVFDTPSAAASFVLGHASNGWTAWKTKDDKTLDQLNRQNVGDPE